MTCIRSLLSEGDFVVELLVRGPEASRLGDVLAEACRDVVAHEFALFSQAAVAISERAVERRSTSPAPRTSAAPASSGEASAAAAVSSEWLPVGRDGSSKLAALERARLLGAVAKEKLAGRTSALPRPPPHPTGARDRYYVVLAGYRERAGDAGVFVRWNSGRNAEPGAKGLVCLPGSSAVAPEAVYHGFPTRAEIEVYCAAAEVPAPPYHD